MKSKSVLVILACAALLSCHQTDKKTAEQQTTEKDQIVTLNSKAYQQKLDGKALDLYELKNGNGMKAYLTNFGARVVSLIVPAAGDKWVDVVLGYDSVKTYWKKGEPFFGAIIGRYGNRIANGKFSLAGKTYQLQLNDGVNTLHGGTDGFYAKVWDAKKLADNKIEMSYFSKDGEAGYPGNVTAKVIYTLTDQNELQIDYSATTDKETVLNLTNHAYFNLNGEGDSTILDHELTIAANEYTPVNKNLIPTGKLQSVKHTPFDFTSPKLIGKEIEKDDEQLKNGKGYDHNFVINKGDANAAVATVKSNKTGIVMQVYTTEPGIQFYSGNFMTGKDMDGKGGKSYPLRSAFCLETQHYPDSPNQPQFPSTIVKPGQTYSSKTTYKFTTTK